MNNAKYEKIRDFLLVWGYKAEDVTAYVRQVAPDMLTGNGQRARHEAINGFLNGILGREQKPTEPMKIARPEEKTGLAFDLWLLLGNADDPITVNDLADFTTERLNRIDREARQRADTESITMSNMLRGLNRAEDERNRREIDALWEQSTRLRSDPRTMNEVLAALPAKDAESITLVDPPRQ